MLEEFVNWILYTLFRMNSESKIAESLHFFIYDSIKILLLLFVMITIIGYLRSYISEEKIRKWLTGKKKGVGNILAAMLGALTPFCSCSSIPLFLSFLKAGIPLGITFSFLITSPLVNEYVVVLMWGFFGWKITVAYILSGLLVGIISGLILGKMKLRKYLVKDILNQKLKSQKIKLMNKVKQRILFGINEAKSIVKKLWLWILVGVGIGAIIHNYVPEEFIFNLVSKGGIFTVPLAVLLGIPIYGSCAAIIPIATVLFEKGVPLGTALAFMMAIAALSFPEAVILRRAMKLKLILIFFGIVGVTIIITGYLFNLLQGILV